MNRALVALLALTVALCLGTAADIAVAEGTPGIYQVDDVFTDEGTTTTRAISLEGEEVLEAWFNFSVLEDKLDTDPDTFTFSMHNVDNPAIAQSLPGTTNEDGRLTQSFHFTRDSTPNWKVAVTCDVAGDRTILNVVIEQDPGNSWSLHVDYIYTTGEDGSGGNGNGGDGGGGGNDSPALVTIFEANLILVALLSLLVAFLSLRALLGEGSLKLPFVLAFVLAVDAFFTLPIALLVNVELNDTIVGMPPYGPHWLGNLAIVLFALWVVPFVLARKRWMTSREVHGILTRVLDQRVADRIRRRGERRPDDPLPLKWLTVTFVAIAIASVAVVAMMLLT